LFFACCCWRLAMQKAPFYLTANEAMQLDICQQPSIFAVWLFLCLQEVISEVMAKTSRYGSNPHGCSMGSIWFSGGTASACVLVLPDMGSNARPHVLTNVRRWDRRKHLPRGILPSGFCASAHTSGWDRDQATALPHAAWRQRPAACASPFRRYSFWTFIVLFASRFLLPVTLAFTAGCSSAPCVLVESAVVVRFLVVLDPG